ncbi:MAG: aldo/keto reductase [Oscillospiraceae bacterium]|nr:aldo/keto reductase [Oscillospiraceae bacterium]MDD4413149.1 aldo/keto reductase [Oscillospiraceae bacterium]
MVYKEIENLGILVSHLGFGCMRFPTDQNGEIDENQSQKMIDLAYEKGVRYFDTAYVYHGGKSEVFIGKALSKYDRSSYYLATKLALWDVKSKEDARRIFDEQLEKLGMDYIDFYLLHCLDKGLWNKSVELGIPEYFENLKSEGKIKYLGFSFHDEYEVFKDIITYRPWDFCQIQLNYMDINEQAGMKGYHLAESLGIPVIVMEPIKGGLLSNLPDDIAAEFRRYNPNASISSWALRWVASLPHVKIILSGMSALEHVEDNLNTFEKPNPLNGEEQKIVLKVSEMMNRRVYNGCTGCAYCMPCPQGVNIPYNFKIWNTYGIYKNKGSTHWTWNNGISENAKAGNCVSCGLCEDVCPQKLEIRKDLSRLKEELDSLT